MRPSWIEVDLGAIRDNVRAIAAAVAPAEVCAVVKADGYGHGDVPVAEAALKAGATRLAVALVSEGIGLREAGIDAPIILLSEPLVEDAAEVIRWRLTPSVYRRFFLDALLAVAPAGYPVHVKVDTGMHRVGAVPDVALELATAVAAGPLVLEGVWTHFPVSEEDAVFTAQQVSLLEGFLERLAAQEFDPLWSTPPTPPEPSATLQQGGTSCGSASECTVCVPHPGSLLRWSCIPQCAC